MKDFSKYEEQIIEIRFAISDYFKDHSGINSFPARNLMPYLANKEIFPAAPNKRSPVEELLDQMYQNDHINIFPWALGERIREGIEWNLIFLKGYTLKELEDKIPEEQNSEFVEWGDEDYLTDLCDKILQQKAIRRHRFILSDNDKNYPILAFYPSLKLALYYRKLPQSEVITHLETIDWISGRSIHEEKEEEFFILTLKKYLSQKDIQLVKIYHSNFSYNKLKRMQRSPQEDIQVLNQLLINLH